MKCVQARKEVEDLKLKIQKQEGMLHLKHENW